MLAPLQVIPMVYQILALLGRNANEKGESMVL
jgi:hypothetical protein